MSNIEIVRKNLGPVTAYKYAVQQGYTGTEQEFAALMASYATVAEEAEAAKDDAIDAKTAAEEAQAAAEAAAEQAEGAIEVDNTLSVEGRAADAKVTGDGLSVINSLLFIGENTNIWDGSKLHGVRTVSSGTKLQYYNPATMGAGYYTAKVKIKPNTAYSIVRATSSYCVALTSSEDISTSDIVATNPYSPANVNVVGASGDITPTYYNFTSDANAQYLYICYTQTGENTHLEVYEGTYTDFIGKTTNVYTKSEIDNLIGDVVKPTLHAVFDSTTKHLTLFQKCANGQYLGIDFIYSSTNFNNCHVWRLDTMYLYDYASGVFVKALQEPFIASGNEWECAIKEKGATDFMGGRAHGDEVFTHLTCLIDGTYYDLTTCASFDLDFSEIEIMEASTLNRVDTPSDIVANHRKQYTINAEGIKIQQRVEFLQAMTMTTSFLCMCSVRRRLGETSASTYSEDLPWVSNEGYRNVDFAPLDLGIEHTNFVYSKGVSNATLFNNMSNNGHKLKTTVSILDSNNLPNSAMAFSDSAQYNKFYFDFCGDNHNAQIGEVWHCTSLYQFEYGGYVE